MLAGSVSSSSTLQIFLNSIQYTIILPTSLTPRCWVWRSFRSVYELLLPQDTTPLPSNLLGGVAQQRPRPTLHQGCTATSQTDLPPRLHGNVPDRPSTKVAPVGCQLVTMTLQIKTVTIPKGWVARQKLSPNLGRRCIWTELHETGGLSATLAVNRLGCFRATRPWDFDPRLIFTKVPLRT